MVDFNTLTAGFQRIWPTSAKVVVFSHFMALGELRHKLRV